MAIQLQQFEGRYEARNPAQWAWRLLDPECHMAGNAPILNLRFRRVIKVARGNRGLKNVLFRSRVKQWRAVGRKKYVGRRGAL